MHLTVDQCQKSKFSVATSHFCHDFRYSKVRSIYNLAMLLVTFGLWFVAPSCSYDTGYSDNVAVIAAHLCIEIPEVTAVPCPS